MQHEDYVDIVNETYDALLVKEKTPKTHQLALRVKVAQDLFNNEDLYTQNKIAAELDAGHDRDIEGYNEAMRGLPSADPADQAL